MTERRLGSVHVALIPRSSRASHLFSCVSLTFAHSDLGSLEDWGFGVARTRLGIARW